MKVWLVCEGEYSSKQVIYIFSSYKVAQQACIDTNYYIEDKNGVEVDSAAPAVIEGMKYWLVRFDGNGNVVNGTPWFVKIEKGEPITKIGSHYINTTSRPALEVYVNAKDKDHAIKIAADERAKYIAEHGWPYEPEPIKEEPVDILKAMSDAILAQYRKEYFGEEEKG